MWKFSPQLFLSFRVISATPSQMAVVIAVISKRKLKRMKGEVKSLKLKATLQKKRWLKTRNSGSRPSKQCSMWKTPLQLLHILVGLGSICITNKS